MNHTIYPAFQQPDAIVIEPVDPSNDIVSVSTYNNLDSYLIPCHSNPYTFESLPQLTNDEDPTSSLPWSIYTNATPTHYSSEGLLYQEANTEVNSPEVLICIRVNKWEMRIYKIATIKVT